MKEFPPLGADYLHWICERAPSSAALTVGALSTLFERSGYRPEWMQAGLSTLALRDNWTPSEAAMVFAEAIESRADSRIQNLLGLVGLLSPLQSAVLRVLAAQGRRFVPFWNRTLETYRLVIEKDDGNDVDEPINVETVQQALDALKDKGFLWRSVHGVYALEEFGIRDALEEGRLLTESTQRVTLMGSQTV